MRSPNSCSENKNKKGALPRLGLELGSLGQTTTAIPNAPTWLMEIIRWKPPIRIMFTSPICSASDWWGATSSCQIRFREQCSATTTPTLLTYHNYVSATGSSWKPPLGLDTMDRRDKLSQILSYSLRYLWLYFTIYLHYMLSSWPTIIRYGK